MDSERSRKVGHTVTTALILGLVSLAAVARDLTFEERVAAQTAIERVYYAYQIGSAKTFEEAVSKSVMEAKVRRYLGQSVALEVLWQTPITARMLARETERMIRDSVLPERLKELFGALSNDTFLIQECLSRPLLADRLTHNFFAFDERMHGAARREAEMLRARLVAREIDPRESHPQRAVVEAVVQLESPVDETVSDRLSSRTKPGRMELDLGGFARLRAGLPATVGEVGAVEEEHDAFTVRVLIEEEERRVVTANFMVPKQSWDAWWAQANPTFDGSRVRAVAEPLLFEHLSTIRRGGAVETDCVPDDTWANGSLDDIPMQRTYPTAVWTGSEMIVWGGLGVETAGGYQLNLNTGGRYDPATDTWRPTSTVGAPSPRVRHSAVWTGTEMIVWGGSHGTDRLDDGGRYDPATDSWSPVSTLNAPAARWRHNAVWTGNEMLVWGGWSPGGGRYDPATDTWRAMSREGEPIMDGAATAIWTGTEMVVWGGNIDGWATDTGGRYDPVLDRWRPTSMVDPPAARANHSAVWTGTEMIVWGGGRSLASGGVEWFKTGKRYDPVTDKWTWIANFKAPTSRSGHMAVWTGSEMVVWGGVYEVYLYDTGGRYDPATDNWRPTSTVNAPLPRLFESAVWTGEQMIVWGGDPHAFGAVTNAGGRYDPHSDSWTPVATYPDLRSSHTAVWTGSEMIVWGGGDGGRNLNTGGRYDPAVDQRTPTTRLGAPEARYDHSAAWIGDEMFVWGGMSTSGLLNTGGAYDPRSDIWRPVSTTGAPSPRSNTRMVWTGREVILWGGTVGGWSSPPDRGGRYDPESDRWRAMSMVGAPGSFALHSVVWTGREVLVWGGYDPSVTIVKTGGRYDPDGDTWTPMALANAPTARAGHLAVWTGREMVVWGGLDDGWPNPVTGGRYNPVADSWRRTSTLDVPTSFQDATAVWTGREMIVWGGNEGGHLGTGGRYDPVVDRWAPTSTLNAPRSRYKHTAVWTGRAMIAWGGNIANQVTLNNGGSYYPDDSSDNDGDGLTECAGDCNDGSSMVYPGAREFCDLIDQDCNGVADEGDFDRDSYLVCNDCDDSDPSIFPGAREVCDGVDQDCTGVADDGDADADTYLVCEDCDDEDDWAFWAPAEVAGFEFAADGIGLIWEPVVPEDGMEVAYDVVRGRLSELPVGGGSSETCLAWGVPGCAAVDADTPPAGDGFWYLVRARNHCAGSWGATSGGDPRESSGCTP